MTSVRRYESRDATALAQVFRAAVDGLAPKFYNPEQVRAWSARGANAVETDQRCCDGRTVWIATDDNDSPIAFIDLKASGYIDMMFCHPSHVGKGVMSKLYKTLELHAKDNEIEYLTTDASAVAQSVFDHWGFETLTRNDFERDGVKIFNFSMAKKLS